MLSNAVTIHSIQEEAHSKIARFVCSTPLKDSSRLTMGLLSIVMLTVTGEIVVSLLSSELGQIPGV